jgi:uncharacterized repeat protein (TIGR01451 family)
MRGKNILFLLAFLGYFYTAISATVSGYVYEDINADSDLKDKEPAENVTVKLFDADGNLLGTTSTDNDGFYSFDITDGDYYIVVDSKTVSPFIGFRSGYSLSDVWAEETYIEAPSNDTSYSKGLCDTDANPDTPPEEVSGRSACFGGAYGNKSDDASSLESAEHKAKIHIENDKSLTGLNFRFSFNVVTNVNDQDDDSDNNRTCQGCLRQFIQNANAIVGGNTMRFIPVVPKNAGNWWKITINLVADDNYKYSLPPIKDSSTTIDGTAYSFENGSTPLDTNSGYVGHGGEKVGVGADGLENTGDEETLPLYEKPELEIDINKKGHGFVIKKRSIVIRNLAINNSDYTSDTEDPDRALIRVEEGTNITIERCFIGTKADGTVDDSILNKLGINTLYGTTTNIKGNYISYVHNTGIQMEGEGIVSYNDINNVGGKNKCGDGISTEFIHNNSGVRSSDKLVIRYNRIENTAAYGIETWGYPGAMTASNNTILNTGKGDENGAFCGSENTGFETGGIRIFGVGNIVKENLIHDVPGNGIVLVSTGNPTKENLLSKNVFYNNGGISIDIDQKNTSGNPNGDGVTPNNGETNADKVNIEIDYPVITQAIANSGNLHVEGYVGTQSQRLQGIFTIEVYKADDDGNNNGEIEEGDGKSVPHGEGRYYLGSCETDDQGIFNCDITLPSGVSIEENDLIIATATDGNNNTSEFGTAKTASLNIVGHISGHIYEDVNGDGDLSDKSPLENVTVKLFKEDGTFISQVNTDNQGAYSFNITENGNYYIVVDSRTVSPTAGFNSGFNISDVWAEQTYAPKGGLCDTDADGNTQPQELPQAGVCFGGAHGDKSDDATNLSTAEHVAKVNVNDTDVTGVDFGFSFNVVTNVNDQDDDPDNNRTCQGCFRQFIQNANAINGANSLRFIPAVPPNKTNYWSITANARMSDTDPFTTSGNEDEPIFRIKDIDTTIDATAYSYKDGITVRDENNALFAGKTVGYINTCIIQSFEKPELEIYTDARYKNDSDELSIWDPYNAGTSASIFYVTADNFKLSNISAYGGHYVVFIDGANNPEIKDNFLGIPATGLEDPGVGKRSNRGVVIATDNKANTITGKIQHNYIGYTRLHGVFTYQFNGNNDFLIKENIVAFPSRGWNYENGIGLEKGTQKITAECNYIHSSCGIGVETWRSDGYHQILRNTVENNGLSCGENSGNEEKIGIRITSSNNIIKYNKVINNKGPGLMVAYDSERGFYPEKNLISQNSFSGNSKVGIDLLKDGENSDGLYTGGESGVTPNNGLLDDDVGNKGIDYPIFTNVVYSEGTLHIEGYIGTSTGKLVPPDGKTWKIEIYKADDDGNNNGEIEEGDSKSVPHGEGVEYLLTVELTGDDFDSNGNFSKDISISTISIGDDITAITIDDLNNTSEFSPNISLSRNKKIYGYLFHDGYDVENNTFVKPNKNKDAYEQWKDKGSTAPTVYIKLCDSDENVLAVKEIQDGTGYFEFNNLSAGSYIVIEDTDNDTGNCQPSDPEGWISITENTFYVEIDENNSSANVNFGDFHGSAIRGFVFNDDGGSDITKANNGIKDSGEKGIQNVSVKICLERDCQTVIDSSITDGEGIYELYIPLDYSQQDLFIVEEDLTGFTSTGNTRGNMTAYKNYNDPLEDRNIIDYYSNNTGNISENYNFGDVLKVSIQPAQSYSVPSGNSLTITHTISPRTPGAVAVELLSENSWPYIVFDDLNCDSQPDGDPIQKTGNYYVLNNGQKVDKNQNICVVIKVTVPSDAQPELTEKLTVKALEDWLNTDQGVYDDIDETIDTITVKTSSEGMLFLEKFVRNVTQGGDYLKENQASPCDILEYKIVFKNIGSKSIFGLSINDIIPNNTTFVEGAYVGKDVEVIFQNETFTGSVNDNPDQDGVDMQNSTLIVDINRIIGKTEIQPGEEGYILYRVQINGDCE